MGSKLCSFLLKKGLIQLRTLEHALAFQAIYGGQLDTLLLEREALSEDYLTAAMSLATGYPPMQPDLPLSGEVAQLVDFETARIHGLCPLKKAGSSLTCLVLESTDEVTLAEFAFEIDMRIHPFVAPEVRIVQAQNTIYGQPIPDRFLALLDKIGAQAPDITKTLHKLQKSHNLEFQTAHLQRALTIEPHTGERDEETGSHVDREDALLQRIQPSPPSEASKLLNLMEQELAESTQHPETPAQNRHQEANEPELLVPSAGLANLVSADGATIPEDYQPSPNRETQLSRSSTEYTENGRVTLVYQPSIDISSQLSQGPVLDRPVDEDKCLSQESVLKHSVRQEDGKKNEPQETSLKEDFEYPEIVTDVIEDAFPDMPPIPDDADEEANPSITRPKDSKPPLPLFDDEQQSPPLQSEFDTDVTPHVGKPRLLMMHNEEGGDHRTLGKDFDVSADPLLSAPSSPDNVQRAPFPNGSRAELEPLPNDGSQNETSSASDAQAQQMQIGSAFDLASLDDTECTSLPPEEVVEFLGKMDNKDELLFTLARGVLHFFDSVQVYVLKKGAFIGHHEIFNNRIRVLGVQRQRLAVNVPSVISRAVSSGSLFLGPTPDTDESIRVLLSSGIIDAQWIVLVPVVLKHKTISLTIGASNHAPQNINIRTPLSRMANKAAMFFAEQIVKQKQEKKHTSAEPPADEERHDLTPPPEFIPTVKPNRPSEKITLSYSTIPERAHKASVPSRSVPKASPSPAVSDAPPIQSFQDLLEALDQGSKEALESLRKMGKKAIQFLISQFPGELKVNQLEHPTRLPPVDQCSAVLKGLVAIGRPVLSSIAPLLLHQSAQIRFYATYLLSELFYPEAAALLARQLQDSDPDVRRIAIQTIQSFRELEQFPLIIEELRTDLDNPDPRPRKGAADALGALGDGQSVPALLELLDDSDAKVSTAAKNALIHLTKQHFDINLYDWQTWWEHNQHRDRIEWLIDGLVHPLSTIRSSAAIELAEITGESFGFRLDMHEKECEAIRKQFLDWWSKRHKRAKGEP